jgi:hypothetical protein
MPEYHEPSLAEILTDPIVQALRVAQRAGYAMGADSGTHDRCGRRV